LLLKKAFKENKSATVGDVHMKLLQEAMAFSADIKSTLAASNFADSSMRDFWQVSSLSFVSLAAFEPGQHSFWSMCFDHLCVAHKWCQALFGRVHEALIKANCMLSLSEFAKVVTDLLAQKDLTLRMQSVQLLCDRFAREKAEDLTDLQMHHLSSITMPLVEAGVKLGNLKVSSRVRCLSCCVCRLVRLFVCLFVSYEFQCACEM
jgi:hypothetical protein